MLPDALFAVVPACLIALVLHQWPSPGAHFPVGACHHSELDVELGPQYTYWDGVPTLDWGDVNGNLQEFNLWSVGGSYPKDLDYYGGVSVDAYLNARNITRSAMKYRHDYVIVITQPFAELDRVLETMSNALGGRAAFFVLDDSRGARVKVAASNGQTYHVLGTEWSDTYGNSLALVEIADVLVCVDGQHGSLGPRVATPTVYLSSGHKSAWAAPHDSFQWNNKATYSLVHDVVKVATSLLCRSRKAMTLHSYVNPYMGYGSSAERMAVSLMHRGIDLQFVPVHFGDLGNWRDHVDERIISVVVEGSIGPAVPRDYLGYFIPHERGLDAVPPVARKAKHAALYTTFESTTVPARWSAIINAYDCLVVSCRTIAAAFFHSGVTVPIHVIPLGVDGETWPWAARRFPSGAPLQELVSTRKRAIEGGAPRASGDDDTPSSSAADDDTPSSSSEASVASTGASNASRVNGTRNETVAIHDWNDARAILNNRSSPPFRFVMFAAGEWLHHRKNYQLAVDAFIEAFGETSLVELWIKTSKIEHEVGVVDHPSNVHIFIGRLEQLQLVELMHTCHCFLYPAKAEGYGLPPREAAATGLPSILAPFAGLESLGNESMAYPLPFSVESAFYVKWFRDFANDGSGDFGVWASIAKEDLKHAMTEAVLNPRETEDRGRRAAEYMRSVESVANCAAMLLRLFDGSLSAWKTSDIPAESLAWWAHQERPLADS